MNKGSIVERLCSDLIAKNRDINGLLYFTLLYFTLKNVTGALYTVNYNENTLSVSVSVFQLPETTSS